MGSYADIINQKKKEWGCEELMDAAKAARGPKIPFSAPLMNWATYGGIPRDKITEFFGDPGGGKTTTAVDLCHTAAKIFHEEWEDRLQFLQLKVSEGNKGAKLEYEALTESGPRKVLYVDLEHAFDGEWATTLGIDFNELDIMQPPDIVAEDILQMLMEVIQTNEVGLIVLDSIPSLVPRAELEKKLGDRTVAALAGLLPVFCRKVVSLLTRHHVTLLMINQLRDNMDNPYVANTPGGRAAKFYASLRIQFKLGDPIDFAGNILQKSAENPAGYKIEARLVKQKSAPFDRKNASYHLLCNSGIRADFDFAQLASKQYGLLRKAGAWFSVIDPSTGEILEDETGKPVKLNGMPKVYDFLQSNPAYYQKLVEFITADINGRPPVFDEADPDLGGDDDPDPVD